MNPMMRSRKFFTVAALAVLASIITVTTAIADWPNENATKYYQPPDQTPLGDNVLAAGQPAGSGTGLPLILADDFPCTQTGPITDIHIWASWLGDSTAFNITPVPITVGFWSDIPATSAGPSKPGTLLWSQTFLPGGALPGHYKVVPKGFAPSPFWDPDPAPAGSILGTDNILWQYNFYPSPANWFIQQGTPNAPTNYWLSITAGTNLVKFGWRASAVHYNDDAVFGHLDPSGTVSLGDWQELFSPQTPTKSMDLAFALTTSNTPPPPPPPPSTSKWEQDPDLFSGYGLDVNATVPNIANGLLTLADDFKCEVVGPITNIQVWASFKGDVAPGGQTFVVSLWSDYPNSATGYSKPLTRLWSQVFGPGDYTFANAGTGAEHFYDPTTSTLSSESVVWLYNFNLFATNPFCQQGHGTVYWLSVSAVSPPAAFLQWGWKTSTNHWGDNAVYGRLDPVTGAVIGLWTPLVNPTWTGAVPLPVDFAFRINSGPPTSDCDPAAGAAFIQPPDTSTNGLDVWALQPTILGDDFPCRIRGPISGFTIWGSWLSDQVDTNAEFQLTLWSDIPALPGVSTFSHPGSAICSALFFPPQTVGDVLRYQSSLAVANVQENFLNPNIPGTAGLIGSDTEIWRYTFFPFVPSCFTQTGSAQNPMTYWLTVTYIPGQGSPTGGQTTNHFGWKTSPVHFKDAAVFGTNGVNWTPLFDPRNGSALDLSKIVYKFPVIGINKDIYNLTSSNATGIQIILMGPHLITWHYDGSPAWSFISYMTNGGDTVLQWYGLTIPPGGLTHVGFETPGSALPTILSMNWLNGTNVIGSVVQVNWHILGDPTAVEDNDFYPGNVTAPGGTAEFYTTPPMLDQMISGGSRQPMQTQTVQGPTLASGAGGASVMLNPQPLPPGAQYELMVANLYDPGTLGATDYLLMPLDESLPPIIQSISVSGGNVVLDWSSVYERNYQLQSATSPNGTWSDVGGPVMAPGGDTMVSVPVGGSATFYRVELLP